MIGIVPESCQSQSQPSTPNKLNVHHTTSFPNDADETPKSPSRTGSALKKFSQSFKRKKQTQTARDLIPARFIKCTTVVNNSLNPIWNEKFRL